MQSEFMRRELLVFSAQLARHVIATTALPPVPAGNLQVENFTQKRGKWLIF